MSTDCAARSAGAESPCHGLGMNTPDTATLLSHTHLVRDAAHAGERDELYHRSRRGEVTRVFSGCYVDTAYWASLGADDTHRALAQLSALTFGDDLVFSHRTAAALWRLPVLGAWPARVHVAGPRGSGGRSSATLARHALGIEVAAERVDGLQLTPLEVTVVQLAAVERFSAGVVVADAALRRRAHPVPGISAGCGRDELVLAASRVALNHGGARARAVAHFADGRADRPGESVSRASMRAAGIAPPELQVELFGASGKRYFADFYWRALRLIGEFDGVAKYSDPTFLAGRTPQQALLDEKAREDDLRAVNHGFSRWGWDVALSPARLGAQLRRAGL